MLVLNEIVGVVLFEAVSRVLVDCGILVVRGDVDAAVEL